MKQLGMRLLKLLISRFELRIHFVQLLGTYQNAPFQVFIKLRVF